MNDVSLDQLRYFVAVARFEHVGRAASALAISPSALSMAIGHLESATNKALFERIGRTIRLSAEGRRLLPCAEAVIRQVKSLKDVALPLERHFKGHIRIGASPFIASHILTPAWAAFFERNPESTVD